MWLRHLLCAKKNSAKKPSHPYRCVPNLEMLEGRLTPTVTAFVNGLGDLIVTSDAAADTFTIARTGPGDFTVSGAVGSPFSGVLRDIRVTLNAGNDNLTLNNITGIRDVIINGGDDTDTTQISNTAILRHLTFNGGAGNTDRCFLDDSSIGGSLIYSGGTGDNDELDLDSVSVGGSLSFNGGTGNNDDLDLGNGDIQIGGNLVYNGGGGIDDDIHLSDVVLGGNLLASNADDGTITNSSIGGRLAFSGNLEGNVLALTIVAVGDRLSFSGAAGDDDLNMTSATLGGGAAFSGGVGEDDVNLNSCGISGQVGLNLGAGLGGVQNVDITGSFLGLGLSVVGGVDNELVTIGTTTVSGSVLLNMGAGNGAAAGGDDATLTTVTIGANLNYFGGAGNNDDAILNSVFINANFYFSGGAGDDDDAVLDSCNVNGNLNFLGGAGDNDTCDLDIVNINGNLSFNGGAGANDDLIRTGAAGDSTIDGNLSYNGGGGTEDDVNIVDIIIGGNAVFTLVDDVTATSTSINGDLTILGTAEVNTVNADFLAVSGHSSITTLAGEDVINIDGSTLGSLYISTGDGVDQVSLEANSNDGASTNINGPVTIFLGSGADFLNLGLDATDEVLFNGLPNKFFGGLDTDDLTDLGSNFNYTEDLEV